MNCIISNDKLLTEIKDQALKKLMEYEKKDDVMGGQIFSILEQQATVLYYPIADKDVWGFSKKINEKSFIWINTAVAYDDQVFAAAHELYHLWFDTKDGLMMRTDARQYNSDNEAKAGRFAAEFLVDERLLKLQILIYGINTEDISLQDVLKLSNIFTVPYKTMLRRLCETGIIDESKFNELLSLTQQDMEIWKARLGFRIPAAKNNKTPGNLINLAMDAYSKNMITINKLEYLLSLADLKLEDMGIEYDDTYSPPSDDELDEIMDEHE